MHSDEPGLGRARGALRRGRPAPLDWFEAERANIRAAVSHCAELGLTGICWDLAVSAHEFYTLRGYFDDWYATSTPCAGCLPAARRPCAARG